MGYPRILRIIKVRRYRVGINYINQSIKTTKKSEGSSWKQESWTKQKEIRGVGGDIIITIQISTDLKFVK